MNILNMMEVMPSAPKVLLPLVGYQKDFLNVSLDFQLPTGSMYGIYTYIYHKNQPNVGKYLTWILWDIIAYTTLFECLCQSNGSSSIPLGQLTICHWGIAVSVLVSTRIFLPTRQQSSVFLQILHHVVFKTGCPGWNFN